MSIAHTHISSPTPPTPTHYSSLASTGGKGKKMPFDSAELELAGGPQKIGDTYYLVYHGQADDGTGGYQMGLAYADSPTGPFKKSPKNPFFARGATEKIWDHGLAASGNPFKYNDTHWLMYYSGSGDTGCDTYCVGAAFSTNGIEGPWVRAYPHGKNEGNGYVIDSVSATDKKLDKKWPNCNTKGFDGFYVATWMQGPQTNGDIWLYAEAPVGELDQGPIALWTAPAGSPTGPFTFKQYVIEPSGPDAWDGGGFSESRITYRDGLFWCFYAGATGKCKNTPPDGSNASTFKSLKPRRGRGRYVQKKCEIAAAAHGANASSAFDGEQGFCITMREAAEERAAKEAMVPTPNSDECEQFGFGVSTDGLSFTVSKFNPVGSYLNATECSKAMAEANAMYDEEAGLVYVYHTQRYYDDCPYGPNAEDLGMQILSPSADFKTPPIPIVFATPDDSVSPMLNEPGITIGAGKESVCEFCSGDPDTCKTGQYCQTLTSYIYSSSEQTAVNASVAFSVNVTCGATAVTSADAKVLLNVYTSSNGRYPCEDGTSDCSGKQVRAKLENALRKSSTFDNTHPLSPFPPLSSASSRRRSQ